MVKRILRKHGYPPDLEKEATKTVLAQAESAYSASARVSPFAGKKLILFCLLYAIHV